MFKKTLAMLLALAMILSLAACGAKTPAAEDNNVAMQYIKADEAKELLESDEYVFFDIRKAADSSTNSIPGAEAWDMDKAKEGDAEAGKATMTEATKDLDKKIILVCYSGKRYAQAATNALSAIGYDMSKVFTLEGGFTNWSATYPELTTNPEAVTQPAETEPAAAARDTFTMAISYMPDNLLPDFASDDYTTMVRPIYDVLFAETANGLEYYLADKFEMADDGVTYTLHIREEATWSDGVPVTVDDILFTDAYAIAKSGRSSYSTVSGQPVTFNKIDDKTLEIVLPVPYNYYATTLSRMPIKPAHPFDGDPQKLLDNPNYYTDPAMITSGAYTVKEINADSIVYEARQDYYRGVAPTKYIVMKVVGSGSTKTIAFENGEIDYMRITTVEELEKYSAQSDKYNIFTVSESRLNYLQINPYGPAQLTDEQREALFYAINGDEVIDGAYGSTELAQNPNSLLTPDISLYDPNTADYVFDLAKAKELADASGLTGKTLTYIYNADRANMEAVAVVLQAQLAQIGVNLQIEGMDSSSFFPRFFAILYGSGQETTWDLGTNGWDSMRGDTLNQAYSYLNQAKNAWGLTPTCGELALQINTTADLDEAKALASELMDLALAQHYIYPLTYTNYVMVAQKYVGGLDCSAVVPEFIDWMGITVNN